MILATITPDGEADAAMVIELTRMITKYYGDVEYAINMSSGGAVQARNGIMKSIKQSFPDKNIVRGIIFDSDMTPANSGFGDSLKNYIDYADKNNYNFIIPYRFAPYDDENDIRLSIIDENEQQHNIMYYKDLKDWDTVFAGGLGFYYGDIPVNYIFRTNNINTGYGEDYWFFKDNNIQPRVVMSLKLYHKKMIYTKWWN